MKEYYAITGTVPRDTDLAAWYETEQCWNCEADGFRKRSPRRVPGSAWAIREFCRRI